MEKNVFFEEVIRLMCSRWRVTNFKITSTMSGTMDISTDTVHGRSGDPMEALGVVIQTSRRNSMEDMHQIQT